ncbi:MAG TPA: DUF6148 family protein [Deltaproteobacteria bacterium]|nr:DUF6148 family protein [Deltaproteobacteria bacterium]
MAGITLAQAQAQLTAWLAASVAVSGSQSYSIAGRTLTRADSAEILKMVDYWDAKVKELDAASAGTASPRTYMRPLP